MKTSDVTRRLDNTELMVAVSLSEASDRIGLLKSTHYKDGLHPHIERLLEQLKHDRENLLTLVKSKQT